MNKDSKIKGRATAENPKSRFHKMEFVPDETDEDFSPRTKFYNDSSKTILSENTSPDIPFNFSLNPYRGCEHGCIYCYARQYHEFLDFSAGLDFETKIMVKKNAPELLRKTLSSKNWKPQTISMSGATDCYQPCEKHFKITRKCLEVLAEFRNPVGIITKNKLITRDIDILQDLAKFDCVRAALSITTLDPKLTETLEPRTARPELRFKVVNKLAKAGIPVSVMIAPVILGLNDHEIPQIVKRSVDAGAIGVSYSILQLPYGVKELFENWLEVNLPLQKSKILNRFYSIGKGNLNNSEIFRRMSGEGVFAKQVQALFKASKIKAGLKKSDFRLSTEHFRKVEKGQITLF